VSCTGSGPETPAACCGWPTAALLIHGYQQASDVTKGSCTPQRTDPQQSNRQVRGAVTGLQRPQLGNTLFLTRLPMPVQARRAMSTRALRLCCSSPVPPLHRQADRALSTALS
jgi:hypothetical protein